MDKPKTYTAHELANCFPMMTDAELEEMAKSIKEGGQREAIELYEGKIIDGRNRCRACRIAGVEPIVYDATDDLKDVDLAKWVMDKNGIRRHLTVSERSIAAVKMSRTEYVRFITKQEQVRSGEGVPYPPDLGGDVQERHSAPQERGDTLDEIAEKQRVSRRSIAYASKVLNEGTEELVKAVESEGLSLTRASEIADLPKEEQPAKLKEAKKPRSPKVKNGQPASAKKAAIFKECSLLFTKLLAASRRIGIDDDKFGHHFDAIITELNRLGGRK